MRIRLLGVTGSFHGIDNIQPGQIVDIDEFNALRYIKLGIAAPVDEESHFPDKEWVDNLESEESAVLKPVAESATVKRRGRPRKRPPEWHDESAPGWKDAKPE